ncbi:hypothetical protein LT493_06845 [Streptomyces tricolor]|nr:hypothetical protein [Streptomyces tricolor]
MGRGCLRGHPGPRRPARGQRPAHRRRRRLRGLAARPARRTLVRSAGHAAVRAGTGRPGPRGGVHRAPPGPGGGPGRRDLGAGRPHRLLPARLTAAGAAGPAHSASPSSARRARPPLAWLRKRL